MNSTNGLKPLQLIKSLSQEKGNLSLLPTMIVHQLGQHKVKLISVKILQRIKSKSIQVAPGNPSSAGEAKVG